MKWFKYLLILSMLCVLPAHAITVMVISGESVSCTTANDSEQFAPTGQAEDDNSHALFIALEFTVAAQTTVTAILAKQCDNNDTGNAKVEIYTNDGSCSPGGDAGDCPDSAVGSSSGTMDNALFSAECASWGADEIALTAPVSIATGTYWVIHTEESGLDRRISWDTSSAGDRSCWSADGASWDCADDRAWDMEVWGCLD